MLKSVLTRQCPAMCLRFRPGGLTHHLPGAVRPRFACIEHSKGLKGRHKLVASMRALSLCRPFGPFVSSVYTIPGPDDPGMPCVCPPGLKHRKSTSIRSQQNTNPPPPNLRTHPSAHWLSFEPPAQESIARYSPQSGQALQPIQTSGRTAIDCGLLD